MGTKDNVKDNKPKKKNTNVEDRREVRKKRPNIKEEKKEIQVEKKENKEDKKGFYVNKKLIIILAIILLLFFAFLIFFKKGLKMKEYSNDNYRVMYENSWSIKTKDDDYLVLSHKKGNITFRIIELEGENLYKDIDGLIESVRFEIESDNKDYKLVSMERAEITVNCHNGYNLFYKDIDKEVKVSVYKDGNRLVLFSFEAAKEDYDLLLYSANNVIYNFTLLDKDYALGDTLDVKTTKVSFEKSNEYQSLEAKNTYEIADSHYYVQFEVPKIYKQDSINSKYLTFKYDAFGDTKMSSSISVNIYKKNLFRYLVDRGEYDYYSLFSSFKSLKDKKDFKEDLDVLDKDKNIYIYKNSYKDERILDKSQFDDYETVVIVYPLNKNHVVCIKFDNKNVPITKDVVDSVKILKTANYSSYTKSEIKDDKLVASLIPNLYSKLEIKLKLPTDYKEYDIKNSLITTNIYEERYFGKDYDKDLEEYKIQVRYKLEVNEDLAISNENSILDLYKKYGNYKELTKKGSIEVDGKNFNLYDAYFTKKSNTFYSKLYNCKEVMLTYQLPNDKFLSVMIRGINIDNISNEMIRNLVSFEIIENE